MGQGFATRAGVVTQSDFDTAVAVTNILTFMNENVTRQKPGFSSSFLNAYSGEQLPEFPIEHVTGDIGGEAVIDAIDTDPIGWEHILYGALGAVTYSATYGNMYTIAATLPKFTIAFLKRTGVVWENIGCFINTFEFRASAGDQKVTWTAGVLGRQQLMTADVGITNTSGTFDGLAPGEVPAKIMFSDLVIRLADTADALAAGDQINITEFALSINNNLEDPVFASPDNTIHTTAGFPMEFIRNGFKEVTLSLTLPRYEAETFFAGHLAGTAYQCDLVFTVGSYTHKIFLPLVYVMEPRAEVGGPEIFTPVLNMKAFYNSATNTVMVDSRSATITGELAWEAKSKRTSIPG